MRAVEALIQLCNDSLDIIAYSLSGLLESLAQVSSMSCLVRLCDGNSHYSQPIREQH